MLFLKFAQASLFGIMLLSCSPIFCTPSHHYSKTKKVYLNEKKVIFTKGNIIIQTSKGPLIIKQLFSDSHGIYIMKPGYGPYADSPIANDPEIWHQHGSRSHHNKSKKK